MMTFPNRRAGRPARRLLPLLAVPLFVGPLLAGLTACGGGTSSGSPTAAPADSFPVTVSATNGPVTVPAAPERIVSLSPTATEVLYAIGAGDQVVAVDKNSDVPEEAPRTEISGFQPNTEAIIGHDPDLVILSNDANGTVAALTKLGIPVLLEPAADTLEVSYQEELELGQATGHTAQAQELVDSVKERVTAAIASVPAGVRGMTVYHELNTDYYSATSGTFVGNLYSQFGLVNIADKAPEAAAAGGYPKLSAEYVVTAAPQVIVLADGVSLGQSETTLAQRPAFAQVPAVAEHRVVVVDDGIASRWGPRVADFAEQVAAALGGGK
jgi:iron complex transport system substrate-binding protein